MNPGMKPYLDQIVPILKDLGDQPESEYLLIMNSMFIPVDWLEEVGAAQIVAYRRVPSIGVPEINDRPTRRVVVVFSAHDDGWILMRRSDLILVPRTEIEEINALNAQRREILNKELHEKYHPSCGEKPEEPVLDPRAASDPLWFRGQAI